MVNDVLASFTFLPIDQAPKDGTLLLLWRHAGFWIGSWRLPQFNEPQHDTHYAYEWRDAQGCWARPILFSRLPAHMDMLKTERSLINKVSAGNHR